MRDTIERADILYGVGNGLSLCLELIAPWKRDVTALELYRWKDIHVSKKDNGNSNRSGKKNHPFYHENISYLNKITDKIFDLLVQVMTSLMHFRRKGG